MLSSSFDICEFIDKVKGHSNKEIIYMADQEATAVERKLYQSTKSNDRDNANNYVMMLKDIVLYVRHGVLTGSVRKLDFSLSDSIERQC